MSSRVSGRNWMRWVVNCECNFSSLSFKWYADSISEEVVLALSACIRTGRREDMDVF